MREVILVRFSGSNCDSYECCGEHKAIIEAIGDEWTEVSDADYEKLLANAYRYQYTILEKNPPAPIPNGPKLKTVKEYIDHFNEEHRKAEARRRKRVKEDEAKKVEKKRRQLEKLKKELGEV